jgi:hypothetical protein
MSTAMQPRISPPAVPFPVSIDARPVLPRGVDNIWSRAERERDRLYELCEKALTSEGMEGLLLKSGPFAFPAWVNVAFWVPVGEPHTTNRASATITLDPKPYHEHEFEYLLTYDRKRKQVKRTRLLPFQQGDVQKLFAYLLGREKKLKLDEFRKVQWHFWKPKNEVRDLRKDYLVTLGSICLLLGTFSVFLVQVDSSFIFLALALFAIGIIGLWRVSKRKFVIRTEGKPFGEPRDLSRVDSWQTVLFGVGDHVDDFRTRFFESLKGFPTEKFQYHLEKVWYWGLDGKEEREQIVLTHGRGLLFAQIYRYGKDLYVGWDGHLNSGQWVEITVDKGIDRKTSLPTAITYVQAGTQRVNEYDVIDLSCLMEWTHAQIVKLCKQFIQELKIDQEVDFKILRGERQGLVAQGEERTEKKSKPLFRRTA